MTDTAVIMLDMAKGYGWKPGAYGYDMVARVRRLKDAAHAAGAQVIHVHSMRRPTDGVANADRMGPNGEGIQVMSWLSLLCTKQNRHCSRLGL